MPEYVITWTINIDAETPRAAAEAARDVQRDPESLATVFTVVDEATGSTWTIDLNAIHKEN